MPQRQLPSIKISPVGVERLYLKVARQLSKLIEDGSLRPGERLPSERDLAAQFDVSRPTIREATLSLEIAGIIEVKVGSGVYVTSRSEKTIDFEQDDVPGPIELFEARYIMEPEIAALAADRRSDDELKALHGALDDMRTAGGDDSLLEKADHSFHLIIAAASRNSALHSAIAGLWLLRGSTKISAFFDTKLRSAGVRPVVAEHETIYEAIKNKDGSAARRAMRKHLKNVVKELKGA